MGNAEARAAVRARREAEAWEQVRTVPRRLSASPGVGGIGRQRLQLVFDPFHETGWVWDLRHYSDPPHRDDWQVYRSELVASNTDRMIVGFDLLAVESDTLAGYFQQITSITLPLAPDLSGFSGCDGTGFELALFGDRNSEWRVKWWTFWPEQWRPLVTVAADMIAALLAAGTVEPPPNRS